MTSKIQFIQTTPEELQDNIADSVSNQLSKFLEVYKPKQPNDYLTRNEVADLLSIDLSTVHNWCKNGKLKPLGIGNRVYFIRQVLEESLKPIN